MAISDTERREVASKLRGLDEHIDGVPSMCTKQQHDAMALRAIRAVVGQGDVFHLLADLIDRPTCRKLIPDEMEGYVFCSNCGAEIGEYGVPNYCPSCGAKVVDK